MQILSDVIDCHIDICSPEVLLLFKDNFDFQSIREDFVKGVLNQEEIYGNHIYTYTLINEYAGRVNSLRAYETVSKEIIRRWSYPIVPDTNFTGASTYKFARPNNYFEDSVVLARFVIRFLPSLHCEKKPKEIIIERAQLGSTPSLAKERRSGKTPLSPTPSLDEM